jgi:hypothetical protein
VRSGPRPELLTAGRDLTDAPKYIRWTPNESQQLLPYSFNLQAVSQYGAMSAVKTMEGVVYGDLKGKAITKSIYNSVATTGAGSALSMNADVTGFTSVQVNPFFHIGFGKNENSYGSELEKKAVYPAAALDPAATVKNEWMVQGMPPQVSYLLSPDITDNAGATTKAPTVGFSLYSTDLMASTPFTVVATPPQDPLPALPWAYAFTSSENPDLTTYLAAPVGMARFLDATVGAGYTGTGIGAAGGTAITATSKLNFSINRVGAGNFRTGFDAVQFAVPAIGQTAVVNTGTYMSAHTAVGNYVFPAEEYGASYGWTGKLGYTDAALEDPQVTGEGLNYQNFVVDFNGLMRRANTPAQPVILATMRQETNQITVGQSDVQYPYWKVDRSGMAGTSPALGTATAATYTLAPAGVHGTQLNALINRKSFADLLPYVTGTMPVDGADVKDTLQVLAYSSGTTLGPVLGNYTYPVLLEFGNITNSLYFKNTNFTNDFIRQAGDNGNINLGKFSVPAPVAASWTGGTTPVVEYKVRYAVKDVFGLELPGTMGVVTADIGNASGITMALKPVTNVRVSNKVTGGEEQGDTAATGNAAYVSAYEDANGNMVYPGGEGYGTEVTQVAKWGPNEVTPVDSNRLVYLTWDNPNTQFSGNIIEFFRWEYDANDNNPDEAEVVMASTAPLFKVHVGPKVDQFPVPTAWTAVLTQGDTKPAASFLVRFRTAKYGDGATLVDMNETPFKQALPATWVDTMTSWMAFNAAQAPDGLTKGWFAGNDITPPPAMLARMDDLLQFFIIGGTSSVNFTGWVAEGSDVTHTTNGGITPEYTWAITGADFEVGADGQSVTITPTAAAMTITFSVEWKGKTRSWTQNYTAVAPSAVDISNVTDNTRVRWDDPPTDFYTGDGPRNADARAWYGEGTKINHAVADAQGTVTYSMTSNSANMVITNGTTLQPTWTLAAAATAGQKFTVTFGVEFTPDDPPGSDPITLRSWEQEYTVKSRQTPWAEAANAITITGWPALTAFTEAMDDYVHAPTLTWTATGGGSNMHEQVAGGYPEAVVYEWLITNIGGLPTSNAAEITANRTFTHPAETANGHTAIPKPTIQINGVENDQFQLRLLVTIPDWEGKPATNATAPVTYTIGEKLPVVVGDISAGVPVLTPDITGTFSEGIYNAVKFAEVTALKVAATPGNDLTFDDRGSVVDGVLANRTITFNWSIVEETTDTASDLAVVSAASQTYPTNAIQPTVTLNSGAGTPAIQGDKFRLKLVVTHNTVPAVSSAAKYWLFTVADSYGGWSATPPAITRATIEAVDDGFTGDNTDLDGNAATGDIEEGDSGTIAFDASAFAVTGAAGITGSTTGVTYTWSVTGATFVGGSTTSTLPNPVLNVTAANTANANIGSDIVVTLVINYNPLGETMPGGGRNSQTLSFTYTVVAES